MATRQKNVAAAPEAALKKAARENPATSNNIYRRSAITPLIKHNSSVTPRKVAPIATLPGFVSVGMRRPSVQPSTSPPIKRISAAPARTDTNGDQMAPAQSVAVNGSSALGASVASLGSSGRTAATAVARTMVSAIPLQKLSQSTRPVQLPKSSRVSLPSSLSFPPMSGVSVRTKTLLAAVPGFFGLMGLGQMYQGKRIKGFAFFFAGALASLLSSWYIIVPARIEAAFTGGSFLSPYALSFLSSTGVNSGLASKLSIDLMGLVLALWAIQLFDAMGPFTKNQTTALASSSTSPMISVQMPKMTRTASPVSKESPPSTVGSQPRN